MNDSKFETVEEIELLENKDHRTPIMVRLDLQRKVRENGSKTRPFVKLFFAIGDRGGRYIDDDVAKTLATMLLEVVPKAKAVKAQLQEKWQVEQKEYEERMKKGGGERKRTRTTGRTANRRKLEKEGVRPTQAAKKSAKSAASRELRNNMRNSKGQ